VVRKVIRKDLDKIQAINCKKPGGKIGIKSKGGA
jgi:hypothetical protein